MLTAACGGILFGYHTAILSGILSTLQTTFQLSVLDVGILVSIVLLGGLVGALFAGAAADRFGRKNILLLTACVFCVGTLIQATASSYVVLLGGRFLAGIGVGLSSVVSPLYLAEIAPPHYRGAFISSYQLNVAFGILLAYTVDLLVESTFGWQAVFYLGFLPSFAQLIALFFIPESPGWLMKQKEKGEAVEALVELREDHEWKKHLDEMKATAIPSKKMQKLMQPHLKRLMFIGVLLSIFQQITGINTVIYYAPKIFAQGGSSSQYALLVTFIIGIINFLATAVSVFLLDKLGRRAFLLGGVSAMIFGQALLVLSSHFPLAGLIGALIFVMGFAMGLGPITWVILSEIYPLKIRGKAVGFALFANWLFNYLVSLTFLLLLEKMGMSSTFLLYGFVSLVCLVFVYFYIPETKGKSLEEIEFLAAEGKL